MAVVTGKEGFVWLINGEDGIAWYGTPNISAVERWRLIHKRTMTPMATRDYSYASTVPGQYTWQAHIWFYQLSTVASKNAALGDTRQHVKICLQGISSSAAGDCYKGFGWISHHEMSADVRGLTRAYIVIDGTDRLNTGDGDEAGQ